jgi:hypothetical protein
MDIIAKIEAVSRIADAIFGSQVAGVLGAFLGRELFSRGELTAEQKAQLDANYGDYAAREARLRSEIGET